MLARPALKLSSLLGLLLFGLLLVTPSATHAVDLEKYAGIEDDDPNPLPAHASEEDKRLLDELLNQRLLQPLALPGPPPGTLWTPSEYEELEGVLIRWGSYNSMLTEFVVGITAASANLCTSSGTPYACCTGSGTGTCDTPITKVFVSVDNSSAESSAYSTLQGAGADMSRVEFIVYDSDSVWIRDYGPRYTFEDGVRTIIDFDYARPTRPKDNAFNEALAALWSQPIYDMGITRGGGNLHVLSTGDAFVSSLALDPDEDGTDEYTQAEIEQVYLDYLNVDVTIYERLPDAIDSTGHIDMWILPVSDTDILVSEFSSGTGKTITDAGAADLQSRGYTIWRMPAWTSGGTLSTCDAQLSILQEGDPAESFPGAPFEQRDNGDPPISTQQVGLPPNSNPGEPPDTFEIQQSGLNDYVITYSGDCDNTGRLTLEPGQHKSCTLTNTSVRVGCTLEIEICDELDNDCDDLVDEGFGVGALCSPGVGECERTGGMTCTGCSASPGPRVAPRCGLPPHRRRRTGLLKSWTRSPRPHSLGSIALQG